MEDKGASCISTVVEEKRKLGIMTKFGDIIDCIDIYKQPSLDHPLLQDHKLQRKPNFHNVIGESRQKNLGIKSMFELSKDECSKGTVPILRTTKEDLIREQSMLNDHILIKDLPGVHTDNYNKTGCYNIRCPGFVQTSKKFYLGQRITNTSICGGQTIDSFLAISQDTKSKNWWIIINNKFIGYFPAKLFSNMSTADHVGWGGRTKTRPSTDSPQMGSGHLPNNTASYFRQMWFKDPSAVARGPKSNQVYPLVDKPTCYGIKNYGDKRGHNGYYFEFGGPGVEGTQTILKEDLELERQLRLINKPPSKSIHTEFGDIIDCIDIYKQPSLDHPLLKDHKLQRKPNFQTGFGKSSQKNLETKFMFELSKDECPKGTVPILRTTKEDLIREQSMLNDHILIKDIPGVHFAEFFLRPHYAPYYGVAGTNSIYNPHIDSKFQISMSHIWVESGTVESTNKISLGWHVAPELYGDYASHIYTSWTVDNFKKTGCYNLRCAAKLFTNMSSADHVGWGGRTKTRPGTNSPQMGSGRFPENSGCYFREMWFRDRGDLPRGPEPSQIYPILDKPTCYDIKNYGDKGRHYGYYIEFGGPGGSCGD
ncbi:uncharacterized protein LOC124826270 [Vigna umbellata]|uniref:uncharacterized protein LOC124826270 n=1 Tax=Vigna umbellata TaxID=87088 RepID=UPI001F5FE002|nr:uncharacterized protein LOC124826270 [Vigna umbellata]